MDMIEWTNEFSVGSKDMDKDHLILVGIVNNLLDIINSGEMGDKLSRLFLRMKAYSVYHFYKEEQILYEIEYEDVDAHIQEHNIFIDTITQLEKQLEEGQVVDAREVLVFLRHWWINHIQKEDKKYSSYLRGRK